MRSYTIAISFTLITLPRSVFTEGKTPRSGNSFVEPLLEKYRQTMEN